MSYTHLFHLLPEHTEELISIPPAATYSHVPSPGQCNVSILMYGPSKTGPQITPLNILQVLSSPIGRLSVVILVVNPKQALGDS